MLAIVQQTGVRLSRLLILLAIALVVAFLFHYLQTLCIMVLVGGGLAFILDTPVNRLATHMPRGLAIALTYILLLALLGMGIAVVVPRIVEQLQHFQLHLPEYQDRVQAWTGEARDWYTNLPESVQSQLQSAAHNLEETGKSMLQGLVQSVLGVLGWVAKGLIMLVLSIYLLLDKELIRDSALGLVPKRYRTEVLSLVGDILNVIRAYLRGQIGVIGFVATAVTVGLFAFHIHYALTIGVMAGVLEVIPYFGAAAGAIPAVVLALIQGGPVLAGCVIIFFVAVNQIEGHLVIPFVMSSAMEMRPIAVLLALLTGAELAGVPGLIVAVPVARILQILIAYLVKAWHESRELEKPEDEEEPPISEIVAEPNPVVDILIDLSQGDTILCPPVETEEVEEPPAPLQPPVVEAEPPPPPPQQEPPAPEPPKP